ncbi:MAG: hypothetical protein OQK12_07055 [Motiliproteus sp.]|nr:hypothetical protein [Motiliproteus sp.]MCW9052343.1 hypothetical protein [Motiliproteus sp.]
MKKRDLGQALRRSMEKSKQYDQEHKWISEQQEEVPGFPIIETAVNVMECTEDDKKLLEDLSAAAHASLQKYPESEVGFELRAYLSYVLDKIEVASSALQTQMPKDMEVSEGERT